MAMGTLSGALFAAGRQKPGLTSLWVGTAVFGLGWTLAALAPGYWCFAATLVIVAAAGFSAALVAISVLTNRKQPLLA